MREKLELNQELEVAAQKAAEILLEFDRLAENSDKTLLKQKIAGQLQTDGLITITIFSCLDWLPEKLTTDFPESFIGDRVRDQDLFVPRIRKLNEVQEKLRVAGFASKLVIAIGDTDLEDYFISILESGGILLNSGVLRQRELKYIRSFISRIQERLRPNTEVVTWSEIQDVYDSATNIDLKLVAEEAESMRQSYLNGRNYVGLKLKVSDQIFQEAAKVRINLYAKQGKMVNDMFGGILLQTETPWLLRTKMLKLAGAELAVIYPWIRQEELEAT